MNILAIGAHWDDIELGCGLTLKKMVDQGHKIFTVVVCSSLYGENVDEGMSEQDALKYGNNSFNLIGAQYISTPKEANSNLIYNKKIMQTLEKIASDNNIDTVFTHWFGDVNTDHHAIWDISRTAFRNVKNFLMYQSNSYSDYVNIFEPNLFIGFNEIEYSFKEKILSQYAPEWNRRKDRWKKEIFNREKYWGFLAHNDYAEAFHVGRLVDFIR